MDVEVRVQPAAGPVPRAEFRWDADTEILTASLTGSRASTGMSGSVGVEGDDGCWVNFDVRAGCITGIEIAVWPEVATVPTLHPPAAEDAVVVIPARRSQPGVASVEMDTTITATSDAAERTVHFRFGQVRAVRAVRVAEGVLLEIDEQQRVAGFWFLQLPPFPDAS